MGSHIKGRPIIIKMVGRQGDVSTKEKVGIVEEDAKLLGGNKC